MAWSNYDDVLDQLRSIGLLVDKLEIDTQRPVRCKIEGDREKRGWYRLYQLPADNGDLLIVGSFGVWRGDDNCAQKVELRKREISADQREALKKRLADDRKRLDQERRRDADRAAEFASKAWAALSADGEATAPYLAAKRVAGYGLRYTKNGTAVVPLSDTAGRIHGLQFLRTQSMADKARRPAKEFWPAGLIKKGHFHLVGSPATARVTLIAEGYATAATLMAAMRGEVAIVVAFDAGNLLPVAKALRKHYRNARLLICADDDILGKCKHAECRERIVLSLHPTHCPACGEEHGYSNAGVIGASAAALEVGGHYVKPVFPDPDARIAAYLEKGTKDTDFNDLERLASLRAVADQIEARLSELGWDRAQSGAASTTTSGGGAGSKLQPIQSVEELLERYALVYGQKQTVFDRREHCLLSLSDMRDACVRRDIHRAWMEHPARSIVRVREVGFDPGNEDAEVSCNLWGGWPTEPKAGSCERLLDLLRYLCSHEKNGEGLYQWVLRWLAYPIQHPGAKMRTALVLHGPQGTGKNLFFESYMSVFGQYGRVIGQDAVEDKFNDWASRKLFLIADEVVARSDLFHIKNKLKALITGDWIRINPKNIAAYDERNHVNLVFLSNEAMPVVLEEDDRRHCVIWTPSEKPLDYYAAVRAEIAGGGVAALHHYLLHLDLGDFHTGTRPPSTDAKDELIDLGLDSPLRFHDALYDGEVFDAKPRAALATDIYTLYRFWCSRQGVKTPAPQPKFINALARKRMVRTARKRYYLGQTEYGPHSVLFLGKPKPDDGSSEPHWLGEEITAFRKFLADARADT